jgi:hypothetical protein
MREPTPIDALDRAIIDGLQGGFPICERPYAASRRRQLRDERNRIARAPAANARRAVLTRFGPMFQVERMGGAFVLAAMCVPEARLAAGARNRQRLSRSGAQLPARKRAQRCVQHVVRARHRDRADGIDAAIRRIEAASGLPVFPFPKLQEYFVEMKLAVRA